MAPLERLKILMQVQGNEKVYTGVWQGLVRMVKTEGVAGCFKVRVFSLLFFLSLSSFHRAVSSPRSNNRNSKPPPPHPAITTTQH